MHLRTPGKIGSSLLVFMYLCDTKWMSELDGLNSFSVLELKMFLMSLFYLLKFNDFPLITA